MCEHVESKLLSGLLQVHIPTYTTDPKSLKNQKRCEVWLKLNYNYSGFGAVGFDSLLFQPKPIHVSTRTGVPLDVLPTRGLTAKQAERMSRINDSDLPRVSTQPRDKQESKEQRKTRKQAIKEERKVRSKHSLAKNLNVWLLLSQS